MWRPGTVPIWTTRGPLWVPAEWGRALTGRHRDVPLSSAVRAALDARAFLWVPHKGVLQWQHNAGTVGDTTPGTTVTTGTPAATKGAYASLLTTTFDVYWIIIYAFAYGTTATDSQGMMDIATGAATEEVIIPNLMMGFCSLFSSTAPGPKQWSFPLYIPNSTVISARGAGQRLTTNFTVAIYCYGGDAMPPFRVGREVTTYGVGTVPFGTTIVPGASAAEGAWTAITTSTSEDHFAFVPSFQPGTDTTLNVLAYFVDIGTCATADAATTATEIGQSWMYRVGSDERMDGAYPNMPAFYDIPSGRQLTMRVSNAGANDVGNYNGVIHACS